MSVRLRKLPYYARSYRALRGLLAEGRILPWPSRSVKLRNGLSFRISGPLDLLVLKETLVDDVYGLRALDEPVRCIVDVGAGFGDFAILAARRFPAAAVVAFEPFRGSFDLLERNLSLNAIENVVATRVAIGTATSARLHVRGAPARARVRAGGFGALIPMRRLEELLPESVDLLKIDCEGAELDVLRSGESVLQNVRHVAVEYHKRLLHEADLRVSEFLRQCGFRACLRPDPYDPDLGYVLAARRDRSQADVRSD